MLANPANLWFIDTDLDAANGHGYGTKMSAPSQNIALAESQSYVFNAANTHRALDNGVEDRLHVCGGAADDAEHFGRRGLMFQGFAQLCVALFDFLEQSHVLDC